MTAAALAFVPVFGLASVPAERGVAVASAAAPIFFQRALAAVPVVLVVAVPVFGLVSVLAERDVAAASGLARLAVARALAAGSVAVAVAAVVFGLASVLAGRAFALFALPVAARWSIGSFPLLTGC